MRDISKWYWFLVFVNAATVALATINGSYVITVIWSLVLILNAVTAIEKVYENDESRQSNTS